jgi:Fusaric acid resistance protein-like
MDAVGPGPASRIGRNGGESTGMTSPAGPQARPALAWAWSDALRCGLCTVPAALIVLTGDPARGLAWAVGVLPAAVIGLAPTRKERARLVVVGLLFALSVLLGSLLIQTTFTAVVGMFAVALGAAVLASRRTFGFIAMTLCAPVTAIGLSYSDMGKALGLGLIMLGGSVFAYAVSLLYSERSTEETPVAQRLLPSALAARYGIRLGLAAGVATAVGIAIHTDHVGWAPAAALFVMRPSKDMQQLRSIGRVVSVIVGGLAALAFLHVNPSSELMAALAVLAIAGAAGTRGSRWYVTPIFSTWLVLVMLLFASPTSANEQWRFNERVGETILGVGLAYFFGLLLPRLVKWSE